jgi:hypothetical protein
MAYGEASGTGSDADRGEMDQFGEGDYSRFSVPKIGSGTHWDRGGRAFTVTNPDGTVMRPVGYDSAGRLRWHQMVGPNSRALVNRGGGFQYRSPEGDFSSDPMSSAPAGYDIEAGSDWILPGDEGRPKPGGLTPPASVDLSSFGGNRGGSTMPSDFGFLGQLKNQLMGSIGGQQMPAGFLQQLIQMLRGK